MRKFTDAMRRVTEIARSLRRPELIEFWSERAAIREYDGGMTRDEAEREAAKEVCGR